MPRCLAVILLILPFPMWMLAEETSAPLPPIQWEWHGKLGAHRYNDEIEAHPGTAPMYGWMFGYRFSERSLIGIAAAVAAYKIRFLGVTFEEDAASVLLVYRRYWRVDQRFQPYVDIGGGWSEPVLGYDSGARGAFTLSLGGIWRGNSGWGVGIENRGVAWAQDDTFIFDGDETIVGSSEWSLSLFRSF